MSIPDKATYILYGIIYIALGAWALIGFLKTPNHLKTSLNQMSKKINNILVIMNPIK
jgi:hypothetical protein